MLNGKAPRLRRKGSPYFCAATPIKSSSTNIAPHAKTLTISRDIFHDAARAGISADSKNTARHAIIRVCVTQGKANPPAADACYVVRDHDGQALAYVYFEEEPGRRRVRKTLSKSISEN